MERVSSSQHGLSAFDVRMEIEACWNTLTNGDSISFKDLKAAADELIGPSAYLQKELIQALKAMSKQGVKRGQSEFELEVSRPDFDAYMNSTIHSASLNAEDAMTLLRKQECTNASSSVPLDMVSVGGVRLSDFIIAYRRRMKMQKYMSQKGKIERQQPVDLVLAARTGSGSMSGLVRAGSSPQVTISAPVDHPIKSKQSIRMKIRSRPESDSEEATTLRGGHEIDPLPVTSFLPPMSRTSSSNLSRKSMPNQSLSSKIFPTMTDIMREVGYVSGNEGSLPGSLSGSHHHHLKEECPISLIKKSAAALIGRRSAAGSHGSQASASVTFAEGSFESTPSGRLLGSSSSGLILPPILSESNNNPGEVTSRASSFGEEDSNALGIQREGRRREGASNFNPPLLGQLGLSPGKARSLSEGRALLMKSQQQYGSMRSSSNALGLDDHPSLLVARSPSLSISSSSNCPTCTVLLPSGIHQGG